MATSTAPVSRAAYARVPYDIRILFWKDALKDATRVVPASGGLKPGNTVLMNGLFPRVNDFVLYIQASPESTVKLASSLLGTDIRNPNHKNEFKDFIGKHQGCIEEGGNILFIGHLADFLHPLFRELKDRDLIEKESTRFAIQTRRVLSYEHAQQLKTMVTIRPKISRGSKGVIKSLAVYAYRWDFHTPLYFDIVLCDLLYSLPELETLYLVLDTHDGITPPHQLRFVNGTTGLAKATQSAQKVNEPRNSEDAAAERARVNIVRSYHLASRIKSMVTSTIASRNHDFARTKKDSEALYPHKNQIDVRIVQWEMDTTDSSTPSTLESSGLELIDGFSVCKMLMAMTCVLFATLISHFLSDGTGFMGARI